MHRNSLFQGRLNLFTYLVVIASVALSSCGGAIATQAPVATEPSAATQPPATEAPAATEPPVSTEPPAVTEPPAPADLVLSFFGNQEDIKFLLIAFEDIYPQITVRTEFSSFEEVDVVADSLNFIVELQSSGQLSPLSVENMNDFRGDALASGQINGEQYGLALRQYGCAPVYQYLALLATTEYPNQALLLIDFLTQQDQQRQAYENLGGNGWIPTRQSVYDEKKVDCPSVEPIRLSPSEILLSISRVNERAPNLADVLEGAQLDPYQSVTIIEQDVIQGTLAAAFWPLTEQEVFDRLQGNGLVVGALFIDNAPEYDPGDYALKCRATVTKDTVTGENNLENMSCFLVNPSGEEVNVADEPKKFILEQLEVPVETPVTVAEHGSVWTCNYYPIPFTNPRKYWKYCRLVG